MSNTNNTQKAVIAGITVFTVLALGPILNVQKVSAVDDCGVGYYLGLLDSYLNYVFYDGNLNPSDPSYEHIDLFGYGGLSGPSDGHLNPTAPGGGFDPFGPSDGHLNDGFP